MNELNFIDSHVHFWDLGNPDLTYSWLMPDGEDAVLGERIEDLKGTNYLADDFIAETRAANVIKAVHVQAAIGSADPVKETAWLQAAADRTGFPLAIVGYADLKAPDVGAELERHCQYAGMRGIRDFSDGDYLVDPDFHRGYALLETFNLAASVSVVWEDMAKARDLAHRFPTVTMVLDHCGEPAARDPQYFKNWQQGMRTAANSQNVICKISGLGMTDTDWTVDSIRPWVLSCIETFGPQRCIFGSNWPVDKLFSTYDVLIDAYAEIIKNFSDDEKKAMFVGNAEAVYRF